MEPNKTDEIINSSEQKKETEKKNRGNGWFTIFACIATAVIVILSMNIGYNLGKVVEPDTNNSTTSNTSGKKEENDTSNEKVENSNTTSQEENKDSNSNVEPDKNKVKDITGKYINEYKNEEFFHEAEIVITNQTETTIDFVLQAYHGRDMDHVNMGSVNGTAKKITENRYEFEETIDDTNSKLTFEFSSENNIEIVNISESYSDDINPYAGFGVNFHGKYQKTN